LHIRGCQHNDLRRGRIARQPHIRPVAESGLELLDHLVQPFRIDPVTLDHCRFRFTGGNRGLIDRFQELAGDPVSRRAGAQQDLVSPLIQDDLGFGLEIPYQTGQFRLDFSHLLVTQRISPVAFRVFRTRGR
jgi:hypothetical protein